MEAAGLSAATAADAPNEKLPVRAGFVADASFDGAPKENPPEGLSVEALEGNEDEGKDEEGKGDFEVEAESEEDATLAPPKEKPPAKVGGLGGAASAGLGAAAEAGETLSSVLDSLALPSRSSSLRFAAYPFARSARVWERSVKGSLSTMDSMSEDSETFRPRIDL